ncbi:MAG: hypothetical protein EOM59_08770 [Clostridia bacterium]|nr:hypothetical protein [Clostridia bacterium]
MDGEKLWSVVIAKLSSLGEEIQTTTGLWIRVSFHDGILYVDKAIDNKPSSDLSKQRKISKNDFLLVHSYYDLWISGETGVRHEVTRKSRNTAYIFALIDKFNW